MRIGCLQFAPAVGDVENNLNRADEILNCADPERLDLLVLPELAFSGYNFKSLAEISNHFEHTAEGISSLWAKNQALKYDCAVVVGYPEAVDLADQWPANPEYYNSAVIVTYEGEIAGNYRKSHLYYTDETWALEGDGFFSQPVLGLGGTSMGICMDLNPYKFEAPWNKFEFANHVLESGDKLVVVSMAWITQEEPRTFTEQPREPDMNTLTYWISRLAPLVQADTDEETIVVFANRSGTEDDVTYAGTSAVVGIKRGDVKIYGILGRGEKELLVVDTEAPPFAKLSYQPQLLQVEPLTDTATIETRVPATGVSPGITTNSASPATSSSGHPKQREMGTSRSRPREHGHASRRHATSATRDTAYAYRTEPMNRPYQGSYPSNSPDKATNDDEPLVLDPEATARRLGLIRDAPPSINSEERASDPSYHSSRQYEGSQWKKALPVEEQLLIDFDDIEDATLGTNSEALPSTTKRHSLRSDVAVRNSKRGKSTEKTSHQATLRSTLHAADRGIEVMSPRNSSRNVDKPRTRDGIPRTDSRSGRRPSSAMKVPKADILAARERFEDYARRSESAQVRAEAVQAKAEAAARAKAEAKTLARAESAQTTRSTLDSNKARDVLSWLRDSQAATTGRRSAAPTPQAQHSRTLSDQSNTSTMVMNSRVHAKTPQPERSTRDIDQTPQLGGKALPILQPASRSRIGDRATPGQRPELKVLPVQNPKVFDDGIQSAMPSIGNNDNWPVPRGRSKSTKQLEELQVDGLGLRLPPTTSQKVPRVKANKVDLSQFRVIEEFPPTRRRRKDKTDKANKDTQPPRQKTPDISSQAPQAPQAPQPPRASRQGHRTQRSTQNTPVSTVRAVHPRTVQPIQTTDLDNAKTARYGLSDSFDTMTSSADTPSPDDGEPKTPVAMVLISELTDLPPKPAPGLKCVERGTGLGLKRRSSAVW